MQTWWHTSEMRGLGCVEKQGLWVVSSSPIILGEEGSFIWVSELSVAQGVALRAAGGEGGCAAWTAASGARQGGGTRGGGRGRGVATG
jgi:hypothetical protein